MDILTSKLLKINYNKFSDFNKSLGDTKYMVNNFTQRAYFKDQATISRAFYGKYSFAGNRTLASTAKESYQIDYHYNNVFADKGSEHQHVVATFVRMSNEIQFKDEASKQERVLNLPDIWNNHSNTWLREKGLEKTDTGEIDGNRPDDIRSMEVMVYKDGETNKKRYVKI
jgi:hypothetical protein